MRPRNILDLRCADPLEYLPTSQPLPGTGVEPVRPHGPGGLSSITRCPPTYLVVRCCSVHAAQPNQRTSADTRVSGRVNVRNETTIETTQSIMSDTSGSLLCSESPNDHR